MRSTAAEPGDIGARIATAHQLVYRELLPGLIGRIGREAAEQRLVRFKVLGGLGPAATADFVQELLLATPAARDREHLRLDVTIDPLIGRIGEDAPIAAMQRALDALLANASGPTAFCLPCNSAQSRVQQLRFDRSRIAFVSMIDATVAAVSAALPRGERVGVLGTAHLMRSGVYQAALSSAGYVPASPEGEHQAAIDAVIYGGPHAGRDRLGVKGGDVGAEATQLVQGVVDHLRQTHAVQAFCLCCTELPLVFGPQRDGRHKGKDDGAPVINATRALARSFLLEALAIQSRVLAEPTGR